MKKDRVMILIPAKGTSRRIPNKNVQVLGGKTLLGHAVVRSRTSDLGDVFVSTESDFVITYLKTFLNNTVILNNIKTKKIIRYIKRPDELAQDNTRMIDVCLHALDLFGDDYDTLLLTLPSSPFIKAKQIRKAYRQFVKNRIPLMCITKVEKARTLLFKKTKDNIISAWGDVSHISIIKDLYGDAYTDNGGDFIWDIEQFKKEKEYYNMKPIQGNVVDEVSGLDIDTQNDLLLAKKIW